MFGPDVAEKFLKENGLGRIIRTVGKEPSNERRRI